MVSVSAAQAENFYREALSSGVVWTVEDSDGGIPAPTTPEGRATHFLTTCGRCSPDHAAVDAPARPVSAAGFETWSGFMRKVKVGRELAAICGDFRSSTH